MGTSENSREDTATERQGLYSAEIESFLFLSPHQRGGPGENQFIRGWAFFFFFPVQIYKHWSTSGPWSRRHFHSSSSPRKGYIHCKARIKKLFYWGLRTFFFCPPNCKYVWNIPSEPFYAGVEEIWSKEVRGKSQRKPGNSFQCRRKL